MIVDDLFDKKTLSENSTWTIESVQKDWRNPNIDEGDGNIGNTIKSLYQKIYNAGDDEIEYFYNDSPIFAQYWDEYEGDLDSIIAEVDPGELQVILDELESYVQNANLAEGLEQVNELFGFGQDLEKQIAKKENELSALKAKLAAKTATNAGIQTGDIYAIDPDTGKPYEKEKLAQMYGAGATTSQTPATAPAPTPSKITQPNTTPSFNATNVMQMPGMEKYAKTATTAPAKTANFGASPAGYGKTTTTFKAPAAPAAPTTPKVPKVTSGGPTPDEMAKYQQRLAAAAKAQPVAETIAQVKKMLETVQTKDDVAFIKKYINRQFAGQLSESANAQRSRLLNEVTRIGALRRRQHSQQLAR